MGAFGPDGGDLEAALATTQAAILSLAQTVSATIMHLSVGADSALVVAALARTAQSMSTRHDGVVRGRRHPRRKSTARPRWSCCGSHRKG